MPPKSHPGLPLAFLCVGAGLCTAFPALALEPARELERTPATLDERAGDWPPRFVERPGWAVGLDGYSGIAVLSGPEREFAHGFVGGLARFRWTHIQAGAFVETTDFVDDKWRTIGGLVGAFLPFQRWADFDLSAGLASRTYINPDTRYGPNGYEISTLSIVYRLGVSGRSSQNAPFAARVGAQIVGSFDLERPEAAWRYVLGENTDSPTAVEGVTPVGGISVGLVLIAGLELGPSPAGAPGK